MSTRAEMTASGLLRIDEMKEHLGPVSIITRRIPKHVLESTYGIDLPFKDLTAAKFLQVYAEHRGFVTLLNKPDEAKAARIVLKDFVNVRILARVGNRKMG
jgi:large subunit GTPase 1